VCGVWTAARGGSGGRGVPVRRAWRAASCSLMMGGDGGSRQHELGSSAGDAPTGNAGESSAKDGEDDRGGEEEEE